MVIYFFLKPSFSSLSSVKILFDDVFGILQHQLPEPGKGAIVPALGVDGEHDLGRQSPLFRGADDVGGGVEDETLADPVGLLGHLVTDAGLPAVPASARVGEVEDLVEIDVEVRFADDPQLTVFELLPDHPVVVARHRAAVHADGAHIEALPKMGQMSAEIRVSKIDQLIQILFVVFAWCPISQPNAARSRVKICIRCLPPSDL